MVLTPDKNGELSIKQRRHRKTPPPIKELYDLRARVKELEDTLLKPGISVQDRLAAEDEIRKAKETIQEMIDSLP